MLSRFVAIRCYSIEKNVNYRRVDNPTKSAPANKARKTLFFHDLLATTTHAVYPSTRREKLEEQPPAPSAQLNQIRRCDLTEIFDVDNMLMSSLKEHTGMDD